MSFLAMQTAIARICVDHQFRRSFLRRPAECLASFDLTAEEAEAVKTIDLTAIQVYAESLVLKKMGIVTKWFPLSLAALRKALPADTVREIVSRYGYETVRDSDAIGGEWVRSEFTRFQHYLLGLVSTGEIDVPYFTDVLEFEAARQMMSHDPTMSRTLEGGESVRDAVRTFADPGANGVMPLLGPHVRVRPFTCDIVAVISRTEDDSAGAPVADEPTWVMFVKKPGTAKVIAQAISPPLKDILELCDGTRSTSEVLASIVSRHATPAGLSEDDVKGDGLAVLEQFYAAGLITFIDEGETASAQPDSLHSGLERAVTCTPSSTM